jgi:hypothetical protein
MINTFVHTLDLLVALKTAIAALQLPATYDTVPDYPKAFTSVEIYRSQNLLKALEELIVQEDRVCFIVPGGDTHNSETLGNVMQLSRATDIHLLLADRIYGDKNAPLIGETGTGPGVIVLKDVLIDGLVGKTFDFKNVVLAPTSGEPFHLTDRERENATGRDCWAQSFTTRAGLAKVAIR